MSAVLAVDCPQVDYCVAGGQYTDTNLIIQPLLEIWDSGVWTQSKVRYPTLPATQSSAVEGVTCPAAGACIGTGEYGDVGMILSQSGATWSAADAPLAGNSVSANAMVRTPERRQRPRCRESGVAPSDSVPPSEPSAAAGSWRWADSRGFPACRASTRTQQPEGTS